MSTELLGPLLLKERPKNMSSLTYWTVVFVVVLAVVQNEFHVVREFFSFLVLIVAHLLAHRGEVHRMLDALVVLRMLVGIDRQLEGPRCIALGQFVQNHSKANPRSSGLSATCRLCLPASFDIVADVCFPSWLLLLLLLRARTRIVRRAVRRRRRRIFVGPRR